MHVVIFNNGLKEKYLQEVNNWSRYRSVQKAFKKTALPFSAFLLHLFGYLVLSVLSGISNLASLINVL